MRKECKHARDHPGWALNQHQTTNSYQKGEIKWAEREKLISDVIKYGIEILDDKNIDRFNLIGKTLTINEIIEKMNNAILKLK